MLTPESGTDFLRQRRLCLRSLILFSPGFSPVIICSTHWETVLTVSGKPLKRFEDHCQRFHRAKAR